MLLLAIDTAATTSVAIVRAPDAVLAEHTTTSTTDHAEQLSGAVAAVLDQAAITPEQLSAVIVGVGPGPFTGLRVGMVAAAAYAYGWDKPCHGVMSLDGLALPAASTLTTDTEFLVAADARRREVYWAHYRTATEPGVHPHLLTGPAVGAAAELPAELRALPAFGPGVQLYPQAFTTPHKAEVNKHGAAAYLGLRAATQLAQTPEQLLPLVPLYLRESDAKLPADKKWARNV